MSKKQIVIVSALLFLFVSFAPASEIDIHKAIEILKRKESTINFLSWESESVLKTRDNHLINTEGKASVVLDAKGRFRVEKMMRSVWHGGPFAHTFVRSLATFDGTVLRSEQQSASDINKVNDSIGKGKISKGLSGVDEFVNWSGTPESVGFFFPFCGGWSGIQQSSNQPLKFSDALQELCTQKKTVKIQEDNKGIWHITFPYYFLEDIKLQLYCRADYDPGKGLAGAILSVQLGDQSIVSDYSKEPKYIFVLEENGGFWTPKEIKIIFDVGANGAPNKYQHIYFSNTKINGNFSNTAFQIDWKKGTNVIDQAEKSFYVITGDPIDEAEAVRAFKDIHGLSHHSVLGDSTRIVFLRIVLMVAGLALMAYGIYLRFKKNVP